MTYEEKLKKYKDEGKIAATLLEPIDYYRFIRDGAMSSIRYKRTNGYDEIYELHCHITYPLLKCLNNIYAAEQHLTIAEINEFIITMIKESQEPHYMLLEDKYYELELDPIEVYE